MHAAPLSGTGIAPASAPEPTSRRRGWRPNGACLTSALREGLATLPRDPAYAKAAGHLRELATVSPSISEFLAELPSITLPLGESIASLEQAERELEDAEAAARQALAGR